MIKILIGLALITLELTLTVDTFIISLLPDFVGFLLLTFGLRELAHENDYFQKNIKFSFWCGAISLMIFVMDLIGSTASGNFQSLLMQMLMLVLEPICLYRIVRGVRQVEKDYEIDLKGKAFFIVWLAMTILSVAAFGLSWLPELGNILGLILSVLSFAYIALFFNFKCVYEEIRVVPEEEEEE